MQALVGSTSATISFVTKTPTMVEVLATCHRTHDVLLARLQDCLGKTSEAKQLYTDNVTRSWFIKSARGKRRKNTLTPYGFSLSKEAIDKVVEVDSTLI